MKRNLVVSPFVFFLYLLPTWFLLYFAWWGKKFVLSSSPLSLSPSSSPSPLLYLSSSSPHLPASPLPSPLFLSTVDMCIRRVKNFYIIKSIPHHIDRTCIVSDQLLPIVPLILLVLVAFRNTLSLSAAWRSDCRKYPFLAPSDVRRRGFSGAISDGDIKSYISGLACEQLKKNFRTAHTIKFLLLMLSNDLARRRRHEGNALHRRIRLMRFFFHSLLTCKKCTDSVDWCVFFLKKRQ